MVGHRMCARTLNPIAADGPQTHSIALLASAGPAPIGRNIGPPRKKQNSVCRRTEGQLCLDEHVPLPQACFPPLSPGAERRLTA